MFITTAVNLMEDKINKIIDIVRQLREDGMGGGGAIANVTGPVIPGTSPGETPPVFPGKRKKNAFLGPGSRSRWMQRRKPPQ